MASTTCFIGLTLATCVQLAQAQRQEARSKACLGQEYSVHSQQASFVRIAKHRTRTMINLLRARVAGRSTQYCHEIGIVK